MARVSYSDAAGDVFIDIVVNIVIPFFPFSLLRGSVLDVACGPKQSLNVRPQVLESVRLYEVPSAMRKRACQSSRESYF